MLPWQALESKGHSEKKYGRKKRGMSEAPKIYLKSLPQKEGLPNIRKD